MILIGKGLFATTVVIAIGHLLVACSASKDDPGSVAGRYVWGHEVHTFAPCESDDEYWVRGAPDVVGALRDYHQANATELYQAIFVEIDGALSDEVADGFAASYDGIFVINEVLSMSTEAPSICAP